MATRLSNLDDLKPEVKIQTEFHTFTPTSCQNGREDPEAFGSAPSCLPSQSQTRKLTPDQPWDSVLFRNTGNFCWGWQRDTTTTSHIAGANCGKHSLKGQSWPDGNCSDWSRMGYLVLQVMIITRRTELRWGERCHIHIVRGPCVGWQTSPTWHQTSKPGWWLVVDCPNHNRRTHWTKGAQVPLLYPTSINAIQFL